MFFFGMGFIVFFKIVLLKFVKSRYSWYFVAVNDVVNY